VLAKTRRHPVGGRDRGSAAVEAAIVTAPVLMLLCLALAAGRLAVADGKIEAAAQDAAREASIARAPGQARAAALAAARESLTDQGLRCANTSVAVDVSGLAVDVGQIGTVRATVRCTVPLEDLLLPAPGSKTLTASFTSTVDRYRQRG